MRARWRLGWAAVAVVIAGGGLAITTAPHTDVITATFTQT